MLRYSIGWRTNLCGKDGLSSSLCGSLRRARPIGKLPTFTAEHFALRSPRRLSAEQLRDSLLAVSGLLTSKSDGPPIWPELPSEILQSNPAFLDDNPEKTKGWYPSPQAEQYCRSLFLVQKRNTRVPLLESFDMPDNSTPCGRREVSTVAPQALMLLNSPLAVDAARAFAKRVAQEAGDDPARQVQRAFELALQRSSGRGGVGLPAGSWWRITAWRSFAGCW